MKISKLRACVALLVFLSVVVGLVIHTGTGTLSAIGWKDIAAICPVGALEVLAGAHAFLIHPLVLLIVILLIGACIGKAFCSWVCPVPHIRDFFRVRKLSEGNDVEKDAFSKDVQTAETEADVGSASGIAKQPDVPDVSETVCSFVEGGRSAEMTCGKADSADEDALALTGGGVRDGVRIDSRHAVLVGAIASSFLFGFPVFCLICPVGLSFALVIGVYNLFRFGDTSWGLMAVVVVILVEVVFFRKWCTTFCPISAMLSLISSKSRVLRPFVDKNRCIRSAQGSCRNCVKVCPEQVDPHSDTIPECSRCGICAETCPAKAISFPLLSVATAVDKTEKVEVSNDEQGQ